jgi:hypothetical protein
VAVVTSDIIVSPLASLTGWPTTFEMPGVRVVIGQFTGIFVHHRPGPAAVQQSSFDELATILDRIATYRERIFVTGDINIRLDRLDNPHADQLHPLVDPSIQQSRAPQHLVRRANSAKHSTSSFLVLMLILVSLTA